MTATTKNCEDMSAMIPGVSAIPPVLGPANRVFSYLQLILGLAVALLCTPARGQSLDGTWTAGTTTMDVRVESWGPDCGPEPKSSRAKSGGDVQVSEDGKELVIHGRDRDLRTDRCWSQNPAIRRHGSRSQYGNWALQCRTPDNDPREESGNYTLTLIGSTELRYRDESHYNWELRSSRCVATIITSQVLQRSAQAESTAKNGAGVRGAACQAGSATRLVVRPAQAEIEVDEELCVRAVASDGQGCALKNPPIRYELQHAPALQGVLEGACFRSSQQAEGEGTFKVVATLGDLRAESTVVVGAMDLSALIAKRLDVGAVTGIDNEEPPLQAAPAPPVTSASTGIRSANSPRSTESTFNYLQPLGLGLAAVVVLVGAALYLRRGQRRLSAPDLADDETLNTEPQQPSDRLAPTEGAVGGAEEPPRKTADEAPPQHASIDRISVEAWICPCCRHGFPAQLQTCPKCSGSVTLVPYAEFVASAGKISESRRCADCGAQCPGTAQFCVECGSARLENSPS